MIFRRKKSKTSEEKDGAYIVSEQDETKKNLKDIYSSRDITKKLSYGKKKSATVSSKDTTDSPTGSNPDLKRKKRMSFPTRKNKSRTIDRTIANSMDLNQQKDAFNPSFPLRGLIYDNDLHSISSDISSLDGVETRSSDECDPYNPMFALIEYWTNMCNNYTFPEPKVLSDENAIPSSLAETNRGIKKGEGTRKDIDKDTNIDSSSVVRFGYSHDERRGLMKILKRRLSFQG